MQPTQLCSVLHCGASHLLCSVRNVCAWAILRLCGPVRLRMCVRVACAVCDNRQQMRAHLGYADASDAEWLEYKSALCFDGRSSALLLQHCALQCATYSMMQRSHASCNMQCFWVTIDFPPSGRTQCGVREEEGDAVFAVCHSSLSTYGTR